MEKIFTVYRKKIYASINGTKGNLVKLSKSKLLSKGEKEKLDNVIKALEDLRIEYYNNRGHRTELTYSKFIKLLEGGDEVKTELIPDVAYWRYRCLLAEKCLSVSPCDPDITEEQIKSHKDYNEYLETFGKKD